MSGPKDDDTRRGHRKDGKPYKHGNTRADGSYAVGKNRPPSGTRFKVDDGRKRGRRPKHTPNADTVFARELNRKVTVKEDGKPRKVSKSTAVDLRLIDNATRKGDNRAIELIDQRRRRIEAEREETVRRYHTLDDREILAQFLTERRDQLQIDPSLLGDPAPEDTDQEGQEAENDDG